MKRTTLLCVMTVLLMAVMAMPSFAAVELHRVGVSSDVAPAFINYTLACKADITIEILPSDSSGVPTGDPAVRTVTLVDQSVGAHTYVWACTDDFNQFVAGPYPRWFVAQITADSNPTAFTSNLGVWRADNMQDDPIPTYAFPGISGTMSGFTDIAINKNEGSPYYGRVYLPHHATGDVFMMDVDGTYLGKFNRVGTWGSAISAPWAICIAEDDLVYVADRTNMTVFVFEPDGQTQAAPKATGFGNTRGMYAVKDPVTGVTHVYQTGMNGIGIVEMRLKADRSGWEARRSVTQVLDGDPYGIWVAPDRSVMYLATKAGVVCPGVSKWTLNGDGYTYTRVLSGVGGFASGINEACGVAMGKDPITGDPVLWATRRIAYVHREAPEFPTYTIHMLNPVNGALIEPQVGHSGYPSLTYAGFIDTDGAGNVAAIWGYSSYTWPQTNAGVLTEPKATQDTATTMAFYVPENPAPVVVPGSEQWTYNCIEEGVGKLIPNSTDTATVSFQVIDANGYAGIGDVEVNLEQLKTIADPNKVVLASKTPNADPLIADCSVTVSAVHGTISPTRTLGVKAIDAVSGEFNTDNLTVNIQANILECNVTHSRHLGMVDGVQIHAVGGVSGVYGYPHEYVSAPTELGATAMPISGGTFQLTAVRKGWKTLPAVSATVGVVTCPSSFVFKDLEIGPLSLAELRALGADTTECSVEGIVSAQPKGLDPTAAPGLDYRMETSVGTNFDTDYTWMNQWYMCDEDNAAGRLFLLQRTGFPTTYVYTWDDPLAAEPPEFPWDPPGRSWYIGKRAALGDRVCVTGKLETKSGYESYVKVTSAWFDTKPFVEAYMNVSSGNTVPAPVVTSVADFKRVAVGYDEGWGTLAKVENVYPVLWQGDAKQTFDATFPADRVPYHVIFDSAGNWTLAAWDDGVYAWRPGNPFPAAKLDLLDVYNITGINSRRARYGESAIRPRPDQASDIQKVTDTPGAAENTIANVRGMASGEVNVRGIVTFKGADFLYVESPNRTSGVRVNWPSAKMWYLAAGDDVQVIGNVSVAAGEKVITASKIGVNSKGNALPAAFGMRTKDVGGKAYGVNDPGVTGGRGALNVGLLVEVTGLVTARNETEGWFYVWDGANAVTSPVNDGSGNYGVRVNHAAAVTPWTDFVKVTGVAGVNDSAVGGRVIPQILPTVTPEVISAFTTVDAPSNAVMARRNQVGIPYIPAATGIGTSDPYAGPRPWDPDMIFQKSMDDLEQRLTRLEASTQSAIPYDPLDEEERTGPFGGLILGDGYIVNPGLTGWAFSFSGLAPDKDQWIGIPRAGDMLVGHPQIHSTMFGNIMLHDGKQILSVTDASVEYGAGWIGITATGFNAASQSAFLVSIEDELPDSETFDPWSAYWLKVYQDGKSLIIP